MREAAPQQQPTLPPYPRPREGAEVKVVSWVDFEDEMKLKAIAEKDKVTRVPEEDSSNSEDDYSDILDIGESDFKYV